MNFKSMISATMFSICYVPSVLAADYQSLRALIEKNPSITRIDELLSHLDAELLENYVLIHNSSSLQLATLESPRVILHSKDSRFIMAFNGSPDLGGHKSLEMIQFNDKDRRFEFYEAEFPEKKGGKVTFSEKNPEECRGCHRIDLRPNWDPYPFWKDAYGSIDGSERARVDKFPETKFFAAFLATAGQRERYKYLKDLQVQTVDEMSRRNLKFTRTVAALNFRRIVRYLQTTLDFGKYRYAFMGAIRYCQIDTFIPVEIRNTFVKKLEYYQTDADNTNKRIAKEAAPFVGVRETFYRSEIIGNLRYLLEGRKIPTGSWSMAFGDETFYMSTGGMGVEELGDALLAAEPDLSGTCDELKKKSIDALSDPN